MNIQIKNSCKGKYKFNSEKTITEILIRIPDKYLDGLGFVELVDDKETFPLAKYYRGSKKRKPGIEVRMNNPALNKKSFSSFLTFNTFFLWSVNEHIKTSFKSKQDYPALRTIKTGRIIHAWMYLGPYSFMLAFFKLSKYLINKFKFINNILWQIVRKFTNGKV